VDCWLLAFCARFVGSKFLPTDTVAQPHSSNISSWLAISMQPLETSSSRLAGENDPETKIIPAV